MGRGKGRIHYPLGGIHQASPWELRLAPGSRGGARLRVFLGDGFGVFPAVGFLSLFVFCAKRGQLIETFSLEAARF